MNSEIEIFERLGAMDAKLNAAHSRLDKHEVGIKEDLSELKEGMKALNEFMHQSKGAKAALIFLSGGTGAGLAALITFLMKK